MPNTAALACHLGKGQVSLQEIPDVLHLPSSWSLCQVALSRRVGKNCCSYCCSTYPPSAVLVVVVMLLLLLLKKGLFCFHSGLLVLPLHLDRGCRFLLSTCELCEERVSEERLVSRVLHR